MDGTRLPPQLDSAVGRVKVLLTGAAGFIGSQVLRVLVEEGCDVSGVVRPGGNVRRIEPWLSRIAVIEADLHDADRLSMHVERLRPDLCLHLAWTTEPGQYLQSLENLALLDASCRLALALAKAGCRRLVGIGTCFEYDTDAGYLSEGSPTRPRSLYAAAKLSLGALLLQLQPLTGMETAWVRLFYQYGPSEHERRLVPSVALALLEDRVAAVGAGTQVRDFLHVEDVARAIWAVARSGLTGVVNVGSGLPVTVREIVATVGALVGRPDRIAWGARPADPSDPPFICANNARLVQATGWEPRYGLEEGLRVTVDWWRQRIGRG